MALLDFTCKEIKITDILKCGLGLTRAEINLFMQMLDCNKECTSAMIAKEMKLDQSTVQRALKKLQDKNVIIRTQKNLDNGGYYFVYKAHEKQVIQKLLSDVVDKWAIRVKSELTRL